MSPAAGPAPAAPRAAPPVLEARGVVKHYDVATGLISAPRRLTALDGVDLAITKGAAIGLVGESGSGKSTLARLLLGLEKPTAGDISFDGAPLGTLGRRAIARRVQPVFQDPFGSLNPAHSVAEIVGLPLAVHRIGDRRARSARVAELLDQVGLPSRVAAARPRELSGGQRQRVAIARALAIRPDVLVCDEPTSALDVSVQAQILNLLADLRRETGVALLLISHDLAVVEHLCERVAILYLGRIVEEGPAEAVLRDPQHPYADALARSVLTVGTGAGLPDLGLGTQWPNPLDIPAGCRFHPRCPRAIYDCRGIDPPLRPVAREGVAGAAAGRAACIRLPAVPA
ncbi:oligopeptide/dipeptide ABC transporter ATP-binding protein [Acuticoccus sp. I52.16.1]|uniref:oligopeptide/dipeptide ABC transporter ATP-binding protein n=1 Tax=Acuticoccus sp. I52.16.1 TaxID=2928472 RepID=UPI001FD34558|nr:oligopeptide/dipeptide ABC transporter ATP-binding protein [Acuticoccus sp. I52.16.1]UOM35626.1 ATP-binding cassette domain-containing protein [Acuticoccus sp. I52.16.1]